jgi:bifunctional non-homologous end joining protein LigD
VGGHNDAGSLVYCGQVGFGLSAKMRQTLGAKFVEVSCERSPFGDLQAVEGVQWVTPSVVVNVDYREFNGRLRHPSLKGLAEVEPHLVELPRSAP